MEREILLLGAALCTRVKARSIMFRLAGQKTGNPPPQGGAQCSEAGVKTFGHGVMEGAVLPLRLARRAGKPAENSGRSYTDKNASVVGRITVKKRFIERVETGSGHKHDPTLRLARIHCSRKSGVNFIPSDSAGKQTFPSSSRPSAARARIGEPPADDMGTRSKGKAQAPRSRISVSLRPG